MSMQFSVNSELYQNKFQKTTNASENNTKANNYSQNDAVLISEKTEFSEAQTTENSKNRVETFKQMNLNHTNTTLQALRSSDQMATMQLNLLDNAAQSLTFSLNSVYDQMSRANEQIINLNSQKETAKTTIETKSAEITTYRAEKDGQLSQLHSSRESARWAHSDRLSSLRSNKDNVSSSLSSARATLSSLESQLKNAQKGNYPEGTADNTEYKNNLKAQIKELKAQIKADEKTEKQLDKDISSEDKAMTASENSFDKQQKEIMEKYDKSIAAAEEAYVKSQETLLTIDENVAQAIYLKTGLTMEQANLETIQKETLAAKGFAQTNVQNIRANVSEVEETQAEKEEDLKLAKEDKTKAQEETNIKKVAVEKREQEQKKEKENQFCLMC